MLVPGKGATRLDITNETTPEQMVQYVSEIVRLKRLHLPVIIAFAANMRRESMQIVVSIIVTEGLVKRFEFDPEKAYIHDPVYGRVPFKRGWKAQKVEEAA